MIFAQIQVSVYGFFGVAYASGASDSLEFIGTVEISLSI